MSRPSPSLRLSPRREPLWLAVVREVVVPVLVAAALVGIVVWVCVTLARS